MEPYLFSGVVRPERAGITLQFEFGFTHHVSGISGHAKVSILLNQVAVWVTSDHEWDIYDLRNVVKNIVSDHLAMVSYIRGNFYDLEISRVVNATRGVDYVLGVDIPYIVERNKSLEIAEVLPKLMKKTEGPFGAYLHRCFNDLVSAMKNADDTGFYCYRAIESLRHHCAAVNGFGNLSKQQQWEKFREISGADESVLRDIKASADPLRHGQVVAVSSGARAKLFGETWNVVDGYLGGM
jgi:hypothetical protein